MPSIIRIGFRSINPPEEIVTSYDLGRELISLGMRLQADGIDTWAAPRIPDLDGDGGVITDSGVPVGEYRVERQEGQWQSGGDACGPVPKAEAEGRDLIEHYRCNTYRDGVITERGLVVYEPALPTPKGRIRV